MSTCLGLFNALRLGIRIHPLIMFTFIEYFLKSFRVAFFVLFCFVFFVFFVFTWSSRIQLVFKQIYPIYSRIMPCSETFFVDVNGWYTSRSRPILGQLFTRAKFGSRLSCDPLILVKSLSKKFAKYASVYVIKPIDRRILTGITVFLRVAGMLNLPGFQAGILIVAFRQVLLALQDQVHCLAPV